MKSKDRLAITPWWFPKDKLTKKGTTPEELDEAHFYLNRERKHNEKQHSTDERLDILNTTRHEFLPWSNMYNYRVVHMLTHSVCMC